MIKVELSRERNEYATEFAKTHVVNPWDSMLDELKLALGLLGLTHLKNGSARKALEPGQWCVQNYDPDLRIAYPKPLICFSDSDRKYAIIFKLTWDDVVADERDHQEQDAG